MHFGDFPSSDITGSGNEHDYFATISVDASVTTELVFNAFFYTLKQKFDQLTDILSTGDLFRDIIFDERTTGGSGKLVWTHGMHTAVVGADISHGTLDQHEDNGPLLMSFGVPATADFHPSVDKWAVFANDTITIGRFSVTPGIRFDHNSTSGSFTSPSIGATYKIAERTIVRASLARGFTAPPLGFTSTGGLFLDPNPSLKPEKVWSYQAGMEAGITDYLWLKATLYYHDLKDAIIKESFAGGPPGCEGSACNDLFVNKGKIRRKGVEIEGETAPIYNISLKAGFAYVDIRPTEAANDHWYTYNLSIRYDNRKTFAAQLLGHYVWWNQPESAMAKYTAFVWDLNLRRRIYTTDKTATEIFMTAHNIFNDSQYLTGEMKNPRRWVEAGLRFKF